MGKCYNLLSGGFFNILQNDHGLLFSRPMKRVSKETLREHSQPIQNPWVLPAGVNCPAVPVGGASHPPRVENPKCPQAHLSLVRALGNGQQRHISRLCKFSKLEVWDGQGQDEGEHWVLEGRTEGELTFYFPSRGRDLRHTQVGGGHDVIVGKAVPRTGDREGLNRRKTEDTAHPAGNGFGCPSLGSQPSHWISHWAWSSQGRRKWELSVAQASSGGN